MPIFNHEILIATETVSHTSWDDVSQQIGQVLVEQFFEKVNEILTTDGFVRVDKNAKSYLSTQQNYFRETYKFGNNASRYLIVEFVPSYQIGNIYNDVNSRFYVSSEIKQSSADAINEEYVQGVQTNCNVTKNESASGDIYSYYMNITWGVYLSGLKNDTTVLYQFTANTNKSSLNHTCGIFEIGDNSYTVYKMGDENTIADVYFSATGIDAIKRYTASKYLINNLGTDDTSQILTLPIYLCANEDNNSILYKDLKVEDVLQTSNNACEFGAIYKIGGVDYFAIGNNFLVKL